MAGARHTIDLPTEHTPVRHYDHSSVYSHCLMQLSVCSCSGMREVKPTHVARSLTVVTEGVGSVAEDIE